MGARNWLDNFRTIADAPGGVQRLRESVLDLAVRGRLVGQDPADEPVATLLGRVEAVRAAVIASNSRQTALATKPIPNAEKPWPVPTEWTWVRLESLALPQAGFAFKSNQFNQS